MHQYNEVHASILNSSQFHTVETRDRSAHHKFQRSPMGISWNDKVRNNDIMKKTGLQKLEDIIKERRHVLRMEDCRIPHQATQWESTAGFENVIFSKISKIYFKYFQYFTSYSCLLLHCKNCESWWTISLQISTLAPIMIFSNPAACGTANDKLDGHRKEHGEESNGLVADRTEWRQRGAPTARRTRDEQNRCSVSGCMKRHPG